MKFEFAESDSPIPTRGGPVAVGSTRERILDCAIDIADGTGVGKTRRLRILKRFLELYHKLIKHVGGRSKTYLLDTSVKEADVLACGAAVAFSLEIHQPELEVFEVLANQTLFFV